MRILLLSDYKALYEALQQEALRYSGLEILQVSPDTELLTLPDFQFLLLAPLGESGEVGLQPDLQRLAFWDQRLAALTELCELRQAHLLLLSSDLVFTPDQQAVSELDPANGTSDAAKKLLSIESQAASLNNAIILRTPPSLSNSQSGGLSCMVERCHKHKTPENVDYRGLQPLDDIARVMLGILLQIDAGAQAWGLYHYAGSEPVSQMELMHTLARYLKVTPYPADPSGTTRQGMNTSHLLETFGVHPRAWRARLPELLEQLQTHETVQT
ncbi:sugar nucleotide-binding protein [Marinospirillum alkaliphilum]|uniref:dTDP-4-dehydrorhamnose reductase n=1 Tax=Marinospirillum alkaliphilum DSM 21637 TaxID=1122209 RepID=A0A1K1WUE7_9GAMM|nr:sugar nucleotide-binding protein [Marinospirillum alkaliphilum]SFX40895.1 dTDP-4-dehydrorhamnose reductase [Marinospirillum alkaliphilum DSM 21637]